MTVGSGCVEGLKNSMQPAEQSPDRPTVDVAGVREPVNLFV